MQSLIRTVMLNAGKLLSGNIAAAAIGVFTLAINARALGASVFGVLATLQALIIVCERVSGFDTWQPLTRALSDDQIRANPRRLVFAVSRALKYDLIGGLIGGGCALILVLFFSQSIRLEAKDLSGAVVLVCTLFLRFPGTPIGILRYERRFSWQAQLHVFEALLRLALSLVLMKYGAALKFYFIGFAAVSVLHQVCLWGLAYSAWKRSLELPKKLDWSGFRSNEEGDFGKYSVATWIHSTSNVLRQNADIFALNFFGWGESVGLYVIAQRATGLLAKAADAARLSVFPEISQLAAKRRIKDIGFIFKRSAPYAIVILVLPVFGAWVFGEQLLVLAFGKEFAAAKQPLIILAFAQSIYLAGFAVGPMVQLLISPLAMLKMTIPAFLLSIAIVFVFVPSYGLIGAGLSQAVFNVIWFSVGLWMIVQKEPAAQGK